MSLSPSLPPPESLSLSPSPSLPSSLPMPICSALLRSRHSVRYAGFVVAVLAAFWHWQGVGRVVLWSGKCKWQWRMVTVTATETVTKGETETETLCRCRCRLWSRRRLASLAARSSAVDGGVDVIRFLESNSYSHPAENSHIAFTVWAFSDDVPFRTSHSSNSNWN